MIEVFQRAGLWARMDSVRRGKSTVASSTAQVLSSLPLIRWSGLGALPDLHLLCWVGDTPFSEEHGAGVLQRWDVL